MRHAASWVVFGLSWLSIVAAGIGLVLAAELGRAPKHEGAVVHYALAIWVLLPAGLLTLPLALVPAALLYRKSRARWDLVSLVLSGVALLAFAGEVWMLLP